MEEKTYGLQGYTLAQVLAKWETPNVSVPSGNTAILILDLAREVDRLEDLCSTFSAGICEHLVGDDYARPTCIHRAKLEAAEAKLKKVKEAFMEDRGR